MTAFKKFSGVIEDILKGELSRDKFRFEIPKEPKYGDLAIPLFQFKDDHKDLKEIGLKIKEIIEEKKLDFVERVDIVMPYVNIKFKDEKVVEELLKYNTKEKIKAYFKEKLIPIGKVVVEFSSPNANKPLHLGHLRNNVLGSVLCNVLELADNEVVRLNLINDRGIHICEAMLGYSLFSKKKEPDKKPDKFIGELYSLFKRKVKEMPELSEKAQRCLEKWEQGEKETLELWKKVTDWVKSGLMQTYERFGIKFDDIEYESQLYKIGKDIVKEGLSKGIFEKDEKGNVIIKLEKYGLPNKVVLRADGTSIYMTQDIGIAKHRWEKYKFDKMIYVVANEQNTHFKQLFKILELLGFEWAGKLEHYSYGLVNLPSGRMKSREGNVVEADDFMDEIKEAILKNLESKDKVIAEKLMLAAIKFMMLKYDPKKDFVFVKEQAISTQGESGVYLLYTIARINSLIKKARVKEGKASKKALEAIKSQVRILSMLDESINEIYTNKALHKIFRYVFDIAKEYNSFYQNYKIIGSEDEGFLIMWSSYIKEVLEFFAELVGVETVEEI